MFDIEKMKAKGMDPRQIEICQQINENSKKRDSCKYHEFDRGKEGPEFVVGYRQGLKHGKEAAGGE